MQVMYITMPTDTEKWTFVAPLPSQFWPLLAVLAPLTWAMWGLVMATMAGTAVAGTRPQTPPPRRCAGAGAIIRRRDISWFCRPGAGGRRTAKFR